MLWLLIEGGLSRELLTLRLKAMIKRQLSSLKGLELMVYMPCIDAGRGSEALTKVLVAVRSVQGDACGLPVKATLLMRACLVVVFGLRSCAFGSFVEGSTVHTCHPPLRPICLVVL